MVGNALFVFSVSAAMQDASQAMEKQPIDQDSKSFGPSGFSILVHSRAVRLLGRFWIRVNGWGRPILPLLNVFMVAVVVAILGAGVYACFHVPCWYDEICMLDPAYHRATTGVWHSIAQWDSFDVVPFAPNYPLLINILRGLIACFGVNFWILRGAILVFGIVPIAALLWLFKRKGILQSGSEVIQAAFFIVCFTFLHWAVYIRPEAVLISVAAFLVYAWIIDRPVLLFLSALLVPLCGLQWNVLLLPIVLHWLVFGGRVRNPILVAIAFACSTVSTIIAYHALGMWPSYLQEAARVGGTSALSNILTKMKGTISCWDVGWLLSPANFPPALVFPVGLFLAVGVSTGFRATAGAVPRKTLVFVLLYLASVSVVLLLVHMDRHYFRPVLLPFALLAPVFLRPCLGRQWPVLAFLLLVSLYVGRVNASKVLGNFQRGADFAGDVRWSDESGLARALADCIAPSETVAAPNSAWFAVRAGNHGLMPLCYAFDIPEASQREVTAVLLEDIPVSPHHFDCSLFRRTHYAEAMMPRFCPHDGDPDSFPVAPYEFVSAIGEQWNCGFMEVPLKQEDRPGFIRYRLFRPVF